MNLILRHTKIYDTLQRDMHCAIRCNLYREAGIHDSDGNSDGMSSSSDTLTYTHTDARARALCMQMMMKTFDRTHTQHAHR